MDQMTADSMTVDNMAVDKMTGRQNDMLPCHVKKFLNLKKKKNSKFY
jgi:hypothetical protein